MAQSSFRNNYRLWALAAGCAFAALGYVDHLAGVSKGEHSLWSCIDRLFRGDYSCSTADMVLPIVVRAGLQAAPAAVIGWVVQALMVVAWSLVRGRNVTGDNPQQSQTP